MVFDVVKKPSINLLIIMFLLASLPTLVYNFPIAKPNCLDHCGDISIPFPFGTTQECSVGVGYLVNCSTVSDPPKLFWGKAPIWKDTSIEITDISLHGQIKLLRDIAYDCYNSKGVRTWRNSPWIELATYFTVNNTANKFTIVGCDAYAFVSGNRLNRDFTTGCTAMCSSEDDVTEGSCAGVGCCQTPIPKDVWKVEVDVKSYSNHTDVWEFNPCGYAFVVEDTHFNFSKDNLTNLYNVTSLPMVVDWAIGNGTCDEAKANTTAYACVSANSDCYEPDNGYGYRCRCNKGFEGNPYLSNGCVDINECINKTHNDCTFKYHCSNTIGDYTCSCPDGYNGDGRGEDGCKLDSKKQDMKIAYVSIGVACGIIALLLAIILWYLEFKRRSLQKTKRKFFLQNGGMLLREKLMSRREGSSDTAMIFSLSQLEKATNGFHNSMIIGQGGQGTVYKGVLADRRVVAIKKSIRVDPRQIEQFINEVFVLSDVNHRNIVRLLGCCLETDAPLLVYEFITNGSLSSHLHNEAKARVLDWNTRLKIAAETAGVLSYLHSSASTPIIHRDVKSDNILLDHTFTAKVADFGASKLVPIDVTQLSTMVQGTLGYLDPEYMQTNQLTEKSDVYSFGVVLLELLTGRRALSFDGPVEEKSLANYFLCVVKQDLLFEIVDNNIVLFENKSEISAVAKIAKECLNVRGEDRPSMKEVAMELEGLIVGGKHAWARNVENSEETESLLPNDGGLNHFVFNVDINSSLGYDSIRDNILLPINGGR